MPRRLSWIFITLLVAVWATVPIAAWAFDVYAFIRLQNSGDLPGEQETGNPDKEGGIRLSSVSYGVESAIDATTGLPSGKRQHKPITATKPIDKASPLLFRALTTNEPIESAAFKFFRPNQKTGADELYYTITIQDGVVGSFLQAGGVTDELESFKFYFQKIFLESADGTIAEDSWSSNR